MYCCSINRDHLILNIKLATPLFINILFVLLNPFLNEFIFAQVDEDVYEPIFNINQGL